MANLTAEEVVDEVRILAKAGASLRQIQDILGIHRDTAGRLIRKMREEIGWECPHGLRKWECSACRVNGKWHRVPTAHLEKLIRDYRDGFDSECQRAIQIGVGEPFPEILWTFIYSVAG